MGIPLFLFFASACGREERARLAAENAALQRQVSELTSAETLSRLAIERGNQMLAQEQNARMTERNLLAANVSNETARAAALETDLAATRQQADKMKAERDGLSGSLKAALARAEEAQGWDILRLKSGKTMIGRVQWVNADKVALTLPDGLMVTGAFTTVETIRIREEGLKPGQEAAPPPASPPAAAPAKPVKPAAPAAPATNKVEAAAAVIPAGPPPRVELDVIRYRNQKIGEAGKNLVLQIQAPELAITVTNPSIKDAVAGLKARIWVVARGVQDTSEYQLVYASEQSFDLGSKEEWTFTTEPRKLTARLADKLASRSGWELYGYLVRIERDGVVLAQKSSVSRLEKAVDLLQQKKEGAVFRL
ncbi:MAG: hypothetical protein U1G05_10415 [Kiritimatiellia bacterium]